VSKHDPSTVGQETETLECVRLDVRSSVPLHIYTHTYYFLFFTLSIHTFNNARSIEACQKRQQYSQVAVVPLAISDCVDDQMAFYEYHGCTISVLVLTDLIASCTLSGQQPGLVFPKTGETDELTTLDIDDVASMDVAALETCSI
jgi:hypothetical protein